MSQAGELDKLTAVIAKQSVWAQIVGSPYGPAPSHSENAPVINAKNRNMATNSSCLLKLFLNTFCKIEGLIHLMNIKLS